MKNETEWSFSIEQCDVDNKESLREFRTKAEIWIRALEGDDQNSVTSQITQMMWEDAAWRALNHARLLAADRDDIGTAGIVGSLLDRGYISGQVLAISRLVEPGAARPHKQVNSLSRLVSEITANRHLLTREVYICRDGLPYDYEAARDLVPLALDLERTSSIWLDMSGPYAWHQSQLLHEEFDRLSGVSFDKRSRNDLIDHSFFQRLLGALEDEVIKDIRELRHKSIAHAADGFSRSTADSLRDGISLNEIARAHYLLIGVYQTISANILYRSWLGSAVPVPQHDHFEGLQKPIVSIDDFAELNRFWEQHCRERDEWLSSSYQELNSR